MKIPESVPRAAEKKVKSLKDLNVDNDSYNYVDITSTGCEGWINLFFGDHCIAMVSDFALASQIKLATKERKRNFRQLKVGG